MTQKSGQKTKCGCHSAALSCSCVHLSQKCSHISPWCVKVISEVINVSGICHAYSRNVPKLFYLKLALNNWPIFICYSQPSSALLFFPREGDSTTAWEAGAVCLIIINLWLLSVLSQPWQFLLHSFYCSLLQGTENTHLRVKYLLKTQDKALSTGSCERAKRANDSVHQYGTTSDALDFSVFRRR